MHEIGIALEVLKIVEASARDHGEGPVRAVRLRVGELSGVQAEALKFAIETCAQGTRCQGMAVEVSRAPAMLKCRKCSNEWGFASGEFQCPACASSDVELQGGHDLAVESFDMD